MPLDEARPDRNAIMDATVGLQSFCMDVVGALDNLARLWIYESNALEGIEVRRSYIGFGPDSRLFRDSLPADYREYLAGFDGWFEYILNYRHALAHRISLYIPPRSYRPDEAEERSRLERRVREAILAGNINEAEELEEAMGRVGTFDASMMHSFTEGARPVRLHPQMISDIGTVVEITERLLEHLEEGEG